MNFKTVILDLDGTITDSKKGIMMALEYSLLMSGINKPGRYDLESYIGLSLSTIYREILETEDEHTIKAAVEHYRDEFTRTGMTDMKLYEGIDETIRKLHERKCILLLASIKPALYSSEILEHYGLLRYFRDIFGSREDSNNGSKAHIIEDALSSADGRSIMIGDRRGDILGAKENSIGSMGVLYGYGSEKEITEAGPDYIAHKPEDIIKLLKGA